MALFNQSTIPWVTAVQRVADSAGASADTEMTNRAHLSLRAAFQFLGGKAKWNFMRVEQPPIVVVGPATITGVSASAGEVSAALPAGHGFLVDDIVAGSGLIEGTRISATAAGGIGLTTAITGFSAGVNVVDWGRTRDAYSVSADCRTIYSARLISSDTWLGYINQRYWDRAATDEFGTSTPSRYSIFTLGEKGKIKLVKPPGQAGVALVKYYRRFTLASASSISTSLDIPEDYEEIPMSWAKWHFLTDKGEGRKEQAATWLSLAQDGIKTMLAEQTQVPDEDLSFIPGHFGFEEGDRSTRNIIWDYAH